jgi:hypothetical protein
MLSLLTSGHWHLAAAYFGLAYLTAHSSVVVDRSPRPLKVRGCVTLVRFSVIMLIWPLVWAHLYSTVAKRAR